MPRRPPLARRHSRLGAALVIALIATGCSKPGSITLSRTTATTTTRPTADTPPKSTIGAPDLGDVVAKGTGNGGYDVQRYAIDLTVNAKRTGISGSTTITALATQDLTQFNLDLSGMTVTKVRVDDADATFRRDGLELVITPATRIASRAKFVTEVTYAGDPKVVDDPSAPIAAGWLAADSGSYVASEPVGAKSFFPCNDHPSDKALYDFTITAMSADTVATNGTLMSKVTSGDTTTWKFDSAEPMATYLVQIAVGDYDVIEHVGPRGMKLRDVVLRRLSAEERTGLDVTAEQIEYFESIFGPFPFETYGLLVADSPSYFALETQTLTLIPSEWLSGDGQFGRPELSQVLAHELAHQWFGDSVSPAKWSDIWLNEGFATYAEWLWADHNGDRRLDDLVAEAYSAAPGYRDDYGPVATPTAEDLFSPNVYDGAGIVLHALRRTVGDDAFFKILKAWATDYAGTSATSAQFEALAAETSGQDLTKFFDAWLRSSNVPDMPA